MRQINLDDTHVFCRPDQVRDEVAAALRSALKAQRVLGLPVDYVRLSKRDDSDAYLGSHEDWEHNEQALRSAALEVLAGEEIDLVEADGEAAFYGPKPDLQVRDGRGHEETIATVQLDFNQPERFGLQYTASDGSHQQPVMIHSAKFGSIERFFGVLVEHYAGAFPAWLSPVQVIGIPVAAEFNEYLSEVLGKLEKRGIRVEADESDDRFPKKIRNAQKQKVPFMLIAGGEDRDAGAVSFRFRDGSQRNGVPVDEAVEQVVEWVASHRNDSPSSAEASDEVASA